ncbi:MAG: peptidoglycan DD-metalloendopeptidase family protein [Spirochaetes bacterium]|jgi:tetratricopeptide (TPR) repeat protein|nr:peptidoglycan DD-metalloendopeptidase family protein [Spirochaetota bacterium]
MKACKIIFPIIIILFTAKALTFGETIEYYYGVVDDIKRSKDYGSGINKLETAIKEFPNEPGFHSNLVYWFINYKQFDRAIKLGEASVNKFPSDKYVLDSYRCALVNSGWYFFNLKNYESALRNFYTAAKKYPTDGDSKLGYACTLLELKKYRPAITLLEEGIKNHPDNHYFSQNLAWAYLRYSFDNFDNLGAERLSAYAEKSLEYGDRNNPRLYSSLVNIYTKLKKFTVAENLHNSASSRFPDSIDINLSGFWLLINSSEWYRENKKYEEAVESMKKLYIQTEKLKMDYEPGMTYRHLAISRFSTSVHQMIEEICPYWKKFTLEESTRASSLLASLKKDLPSEIGFIMKSLSGHILYREGKTSDAAIMLSNAYDDALKLDIAKNGNYSEPVIISFPMRGIYNAGNINSNKYITHMGLNRNCYDISGSDEKGSEMIDAKKSRGSVLKEWLGYGRPIFSPVNGRVLDAVDTNPDNSPFQERLGRGNYLYIRDPKGRIFVFYHIKQKSLRVKKDDEINAGKQLAELGNSASTSPHLHFAVYSKDWIVTLPVFFINYTLIDENGKTFIPMGRPGSGKKEMEIIESR